PCAAESHARADRHARADLELRDRLPRLAHLCALTGDDRQLLDRGVELLGVRLRFAHAHVERDLLEMRNVHDRCEAELFLEARPQLLLVQNLEPRLIRLAGCFFTDFAYARSHDYR